MEEEIRKLKKEDFMEYIELMKEFRPIEVCITKEIFDDVYKKIFNRGKIFVMILDRKIVGSMTLLEEYKFVNNLSKYIHIEDVIVKREFRGRGIGTKLLNYVKKYSEDCNFFKIILNCDLKICNFYEKSGFEKRDIQMSYLLNK